MRNFYVAIFLLHTSLFFIGCNNQKTVSSQKSIRIGMLPADAPFMSINDVGEAEGFDVDVAHQIGKVLNRNIKIVDMGMSELFIALECNRIDALMCGLSITSKRKELYHMIHYQGNGVKTFPLVFWNQAPYAVKTMEDLVTHFQDHPCIIAVLPGTLQECFAQQFEGIQTKAIDSYADIILELQYGKVDAALFDEAIQSYVERIPSCKVINVPLGTFESSGHGIALNKSNDALAAEIKHAVTTLKNNQTIAELEQKWNMNGEHHE